MCFALGTLQHQWRFKIESTHHPPAPITYVHQYNRGTYNTPATHAPTHHAHLPTMYSSTAVFMHSSLLCRTEIFHVFMIRRHYGDRQPVPGSTFPRPPRTVAACSVFRNTISPTHCCCAVYHSQAEFLVVSPPLFPASSPRTLQRWPNGGGYQGWDNRFLSSSRRPSSYQDIWSPCTLVNPGRSTSRVYANLGHIFHHSEKSSLATFFFGRSRLFFLYVRTSSVRTCSRHRKYVQQQIITYIHHQLYVQQ